MGTASSSAPVSRFGPELRRWRTLRRFSQLELAARADVSQRHLSFLETGRSNPSREMVIHLAATLDVPLRQQNELLLAAGFAPAFRESSLDEPVMERVRDALDFLLSAHEPYPAVVLDRRWNVALANRAATRLVGALLGRGEPDGRPLNMARLAFHPDGLRTVTVDWEATAAELLLRLERECSDRSADQELAALWEEVSGYPGVAELRRRPRLPSGHDLLLPIHYRTAQVDVRLFSTISTMGDPHDITLAELRLETFFPADRQSEAVLRRLAADG